MSSQDTRIPSAQFQEILEENSLLIRIAYPTLLPLYQLVKNRETAIYLCSKEACVLKAMSEGTKINELRSYLSVQEEGFLVSEEALGTNSSSLCLQTRRPIQVFGSEHFQQRAHPFICSSVPIIDASQKLLGCLTMLCPLEHYQPFTRAILITTADSIGKEFQLRRTNRMLMASNNRLKTTVNAQKNGLLLLDEQRNVLFSNRLAAQFLNLPQMDLIGKNLDDLLPPDELPAEMRTLSSSIRNLRVNTKNHLGEPIKIIVDITVEHDPSGTAGIVLSIEQQKDVYKRTNMLSGGYASYSFGSILGRSPALKRTLELGELAAKSDSTVLILGESGTGKEMLAQAIHNASVRANEPFLAINCASLPRSLIESELFGYERGSFTGASKEGNPGKFELASGGTIFLDEIGDMPIDLQASLLRVLQNHTVTRLGGHAPVPVNVRIISATNRDLYAEVLQHRFREDLYYRLNVVSITMPPLRERPEDIPLLIEHFTAACRKRLGKEISGISPDAVRLLKQYPWPGNVRQLENIIERAVNFMPSSRITPADLPEEITGYHQDGDGRSFGARPEGSPQAAAPVSIRPHSPEVREYEKLVQLLTIEKGHVRSVAADMGMPLSTLYDKLKKYNLNPGDYRNW